MTLSSDRQAASAAIGTGGDPGTPGRPTRMRRVAAASFSGTVIEFYDFNIYGTAAALVFPRVFFPALGPAVATVASLATFGVAFLARPIGSVVFGHFGDRLGRKNTLIVTMVLMGTATFLVGAMPTPSTIGVLAPILLVVLRVCQGIAAGGEWAGAVLFASEYAPRERRGFWSMMPSMGGACATILANATFLAVTLFVPTATFVAGAWRIPFLASAVLVLVGLWIRLRIAETPVFSRLAASAGVAKIPFVDVLRRQPKQVVLAFGTAVTAFALAHLSSSYLINYGKDTLHLSQTYVLSIAVFAGFLLAAGTIAGAVLSDRIGRRRVLTIAAAAAVLWALILFPILSAGSGAGFAVGLPVTQIVGGLAIGPLGAFMSELFDTRYRYTAAGLSYSLAGVVGGGVLPAIAAPITAGLGTLAFGGLLALVAIGSLVCVRLVRGTGQTSDLDSAVDA